MKTSALIAILVVILFTGLGGIAYLLTHKPQDNTAFQTSLNIGGNFTLINQEGDKVSSEIYDDKYKLVYFGFTHCPAVCPTELQRIAEVLTLLPEELADQIQPIFISVDPERDTPDVLKDYMPLFGKNFVGFTGTVDEIEAVKKQFRIYASKVVMEGASDYTVDHSSYIYMLDKDDKVINLFDTHDTVSEIVAEIGSIIL